MSNPLYGESTHPYSSFLDSLQKPARYIGNEHFMQKKDWNNVSSKVALCFPDAYEIGMSHLGMKILYQELNNRQDILVERCFAPWIDMEKELRERDLPLVTLESFRPLSDFQIVGFSLQYELTYTNILMMLDLGGVPIWQKDRDQKHPFVICGGPCATHPEPLAPFMDIVVIGDGEDLFVRLAHFIAQQRELRVSREFILKQLANWDGLYIPSLYQTEIDPLTNFEVITQNEEQAPFPVQRFFVKDLNKYPTPTKSPIPHLTAIFDRFSIELARGCTEGCRFCQAGMIYRPVRERHPQDVINSVLTGMKQGGFDEASLTCLSTADYSAVTPLLLDLLEKMKDENASLGISSLRAYGLDKRVMDKLSEVKNTSLTFAPEAGTERMRKVINKNISEADLMQTAEDVFSRGFSKMKLYFMIGLPTETDEDVQGIMHTAFRAKQVARKVGAKRANVTVSVSSFVPKPHTPFQWSPMISLSEIERKQEMLFQMSKEYKLAFRKHVSKSSIIEGVVARGDRKVAQSIFMAYKKGARFDGWNETFNFNLWKEVFEEQKLALENYLGTIRMDGRLPWDHIHVGLKDGFLAREYKKSLQDRLSIPCGKPAFQMVHHTNLQALEKTHDEQKKRLVCYHCGVACDLTQMVDERRDYLKSLNAIEDKTYDRLVVKKSILDHRDKRGQNVGYTYRINFTKLGPISYISHLDMQKIMSRIFRRAQVDILYSEGYNPRPLFSFGPALALGVSSLSEFFDVRVPKMWEDLTATLFLLNSHSEEGIIFKDIQEIERSTVSIQESTSEFIYFYPLKNTSNIQERLDVILKSEEFIIEAYNKRAKTHVKKNVRPKIKDVKLAKIDLSQEYLRPILEMVSLYEGDGLEVQLQVENGSSVKPTDLQKTLIESGIDVGRPIKMGVRLKI